MERLYLCKLIARQRRTANSVPVARRTHLLSAPAVVYEMTQPTQRSRGVSPFTTLQQRSCSGIGPVIAIRPIMANITYTKQELHNMSQRRQKRNEPRLTYTEKTAQFRRVMYDREQSHRRYRPHTHRHAHHNTPFAWLPHIYTSLNDRRFAGRTSSV